MRDRSEWRRALALMAAASGVGLASGREMAIFFGQFKSAAWAGILAAAALYGLLTGLLTARPLSCPPEPRRLALAFQGLNLTLAALTAAVMLSSLGRVGALTLPLRHSYAFGALFGLLAAFGLSRLSESGLAALGALVSLYAGGFYIACAADPRPVTLHVRGAVDYTLAGCLPAALLLGMLYAALNACAARWGVRDRGAGPVRPLGLALKSAALLAALLSCALLALRRGGDAAMAQPLPWVILSARWGLPGFWLCALLKALCAAATLACALRPLMHPGACATPRALRVGAWVLAVLMFAVLSAA